MATRLSDYALIGNARAAALVSNNGVIDWCCLPEFDSPSIFAAILDREKGGYFSISPVGNYSSEQRYLPDTNVVETIFETQEGKARLLDAFTAQTEEAKKQNLFPDHELLRIVEGISGTVEFRLEYAPKTYYGKNTPKLDDRQKLGIHFIWKENSYTLLSTLLPGQLTVNKSNTGCATANFKVNQGEQVIFSFSYSAQSPAIVPELKTTAPERMKQTIDFWKNWIGQCTYAGLYKEQVRRSALVLKLLTYAPSGAIVAAPTTSLPEKPGGERNWDYRYCWLRDASFTIRALLKLGFEEEANAYMNWILHATQLTRPKLQVVYNVFGHASLPEQKLDWLKGYADSAPVRIGNGADKQFQLDVYGEVLDAVFAYSPLLKEIDHNTKKFVVGMGNIICDNWEKPDNGIWEIRSSIIHHTHSKVLAWVGLDRLIKLTENYGWHDAPLDKFIKTAARIREEIEQHGYNEELNSYTHELKGSTVDASLLTLSLTGYCDPASPRMVATTKLIQERLSENNLLYRYLNRDDGLSGKEGSFGICNYWLIENLARSGQIEKAMTLFETIADCASPTGLLSEEIDTETYELLGNYPQGFTHIGLINAAFAIHEVYQKTPAQHEYL
ncbi:glycoside hydrolase family 15 protein [Pontibacter sp. BT310]|uniref:Glycoside hydrolase family 15 protein n=1 Tax=Pontibacter populi TaxID=890055 RepID=A0ABS6XC29_9BACT|nr:MULTISPECIES: glycoside hydrolase family 15 protein [Pontibacter]MBJ6118190.1 glycoside hydrolase family 15 protein [Pontibacter sp. BT310]MBR0570617.1 glycoside hydrolase family 15 protein [Microvirga sp. STS03]MBW3365043.1 glycoside hydrolase family 15 protein [Pontibacter populi]